ncbi:MAG: EpsI family protein [Aquabacterium sp.]
MSPKTLAQADAPDLERYVPKQIGEWHVVESPLVQVGLTTGKETDMNQPYDETVMRTYQDDKGHTIQIALAWGQRQRQEIKIHRPELCYPAQGYSVSALHEATFPAKTTSGQPITGKRMVTKDRNDQTQLVSYWIRIGHVYSSSAWVTRMHILREGLQGRMTDGILVRASQYTSGDPGQQEATFQRQEQFLADLVQASPPQARDALAR